ncbi:MAG: hypothetical protein MZU95_16705 [Desulfomicrobium escambiense]|nr:hypothetical protein [Desulfomicrobium escambiense]
MRRDSATLNERSTCFRAASRSPTPSELRARPKSPLASVTRSPAALLQRECLIEVPDRDGVLAQKVVSLTQISMHLRFESWARDGSRQLERALQVATGLVGLVADEVDHADESEGECLPPWDPLLVGEGEGSLESAEGPGVVPRCQIGVAERDEDVDRDVLRGPALSKSCKARSQCLSAESVSAMSR